MSVVDNKDLSQYGKSEPLIPGSLIHRPDLYLKTTISSYTGGRFYSGMNKLQTAIQDGISDSLCSNEVFWDFGDDGDSRARLQNDRSGARLHTVDIRPKRGDLDLLYPKIYLQANTSNNLSSRLRLAENGLTYPIQLHGLDVKARTEGGRLSISYSAKYLSFLQQSSGHLETRLDVLIGYFNNGTRLRAGEHTEVVISKKPADLEKFIEQSPHLIEKLLTPPPEASELRLVIREQASGRMGTALIRLERQ